MRGESKRPHVLTFVVLGGEGKTSLVARRAVVLAADGWPGCDAAFAWSFYSQGTKEQNAASSDLFLAEALLLRRRGDGRQPADGGGQGQAAGGVGRTAAALLILDGLEPRDNIRRHRRWGRPAEGQRGVGAAQRAGRHELGLCFVTTR